MQLVQMPLAVLSIPRVKVTFAHTSIRYFFICTDLTVNTIAPTSFMTASKQVESPTNFASGQVLELEALV